METNEKTTCRFARKRISGIKTGRRVQTHSFARKSIPKSMHGQSRGVLSWLLSSRPPQHF